MKINGIDFMFELEHIGLGMSCIEACCKSICREFGLEYIGFDKADGRLYILCRYELEKIDYLKELVEPYGFYAYEYGSMYPPQYIIEYDLRGKKNE